MESLWNDMFLTDNMMLSWHETLFEREDLPIVLIIAPDILNTGTLPPILRHIRPQRPLRLL